MYLFLFCIRTRNFLTFNTHIDNIINDYNIGIIHSLGGKMLYPKEYLNSVKEINIELLSKTQIRGIILDVDNTLIDFDKKMPSMVLRNG